MQTPGSSFLIFTRPTIRQKIRIRFESSLKIHRKGFR